MTRPTAEDLARWKALAEGHQTKTWCERAVPALVAEVERLRAAITWHLEWASCPEAWSEVPANRACDRLRAALTEEAQDA